MNRPIKSLLLKEIEQQISEIYNNTLQTIYLNENGGGHVVKVNKLEDTFFIGTGAFIEIGSQLYVTPLFAFVDNDNKPLGIGKIRLLPVYLRYTQHEKRHTKFIRISDLNNNLHSLRFRKDLMIDCDYDKELIVDLMSDEVIEGFNSAFESVQSLNNKEKYLLGNLFERKYYNRTLVDVYALIEVIIKSRED